MSVLAWAGGLVDHIVDRAAGAPVVAGGVGEAPGVAVVRAGIGVRGAAQVQVTAQVRAAHARRGARGGVGVGVVGHRVRSHRDRRGGLSDAVVDRAAGASVVAGGVGEAPGVAVVRASIGVRGAAQDQVIAQVRAAHARRGARGGVGVGVVGHRVRSHRDRRGGRSDGAGSAGGGRQRVVTRQRPGARREFARRQAGGHRGRRRHVRAVVRARGLGHREALAARPSPRC